MDEGTPTGKGSRDSRDLLAEAYDLYGKALYGYALMILANPPAAEDAVQQAFVRFAAMGDRTRDVKQWKSYLRKVVRNECYRMLRLRRLDSLDRQVGTLLEPASDEAIAPEERDAVERAVRALAAEQREVVHMRIYENMTFQQIADELDVSINTVASRYRYAMDRLRQLLASLKEDQR